MNDLTLQVPWELSQGFIVCQSFRNSLHTACTVNMVVKINLINDHRNCKYCKPATLKLELILYLTRLKLWVLKLTFFTDDEKWSTVQMFTGVYRVCQSLRKSLHTACAVNMVVMVLYNLINDHHNFKHCKQATNQIKMASGEKNRRSYECSPLLGIFLCVINAKPG